MFVSAIKKTSRKVARKVAALCFTLLYLNPRRRRRRSSTVVVEWQNLPANVLVLIAERSEIHHLRAVCSSWRSSLPLPYKAHHPHCSAKIPLQPLFTSVGASWRNLPTDILLMIAERSEIRHLRAVCSSWRSSLPLPYKAHHPLRSTIIPLPLYFQDRGFGKYHNGTITERNIYCLERLDSPKSCWIVKLEEMSSGKMRFYHPLSNRLIPTYRLNLPAVVDFLDCRIIHVGKEYDYRVYDDERYKVVLSDDAMLCRFDVNFDYDIESHPRKLGYLKFGDERWTMIVDEGKDELSFCPEDIIYHKQKFYVVDGGGRIIVFDSSFKFEEFVSPPEHLYAVWSFLQSDGDLFVVKRYRKYRELVHKVYRLNSDEQQWNEVTNLGDQSFFIGNFGCTFSIGSAQFSGCGKNFIYCTDTSFRQKFGSLPPGHDFGILSLEDNSYRPLNMISQYSQLFWPIPSWLKQAKVENCAMRV